MAPTLRRTVAVVSVALSTLIPACRCGESVKPADAQVELGSINVEFLPTYVGASRVMTVKVSNVGKSACTLGWNPASVNGFSFVVPDRLLQAGETAELELRFSPTGSTESRATFYPTGCGATGQVNAHGVGLTPLDCPSATECASYKFSADLGACVATAATDGTLCGDLCLPDGKCVQGECRGTPKKCDDGNSCTADACAPVLGCVTVDLSANCPPPPECPTSPPSARTSQARKVLDVVLRGTPRALVADAAGNVYGLADEAVTAPDGGLNTVTRLFSVSLNGRVRFLRDLPATDGDTTSYRRVALVGASVVVESGRGGSGALANIANLGSAPSRYQTFSAATGEPLADSASWTNGTTTPPLSWSGLISTTNPIRADATSVWMLAASCPPGTFCLLPTSLARFNVEDGGARDFARIQWPWPDAGLAEMRSGFVGMRNASGDMLLQAQLWVPGVDSALYGSHRAFHVRVDAAAGVAVARELPRLDALWNATAFVDDQLGGFELFTLSDGGQSASGSHGVTWSGVLGARTLWNAELAWQPDGGTTESQSLYLRAIDRQTLEVTARVPVVPGYGTLNTLEVRNWAYSALSGPSGAIVMGTPASDSGITYVAQAQLDGGVDFACRLETTESVAPLFLPGRLVTGRANHLSVYLMPGVESPDSGWISQGGSPRGDWTPVETP